MANLGFTISNKKEEVNNSNKKMNDTASNDIYLLFIQNGVPLYDEETIYSQNIESNGSLASTSDFIPVGWDSPY